MAEQQQGDHAPDGDQQRPRRPDPVARAFVNALAIAAGLFVLLGWAV